VFVDFTVTRAAQAARKAAAAGAAKADAGAPPPCKKARAE
jgi:hypothetical protein